MNNLHSFEALLSFTLQATLVLLCDWALDIAKLPSAIRGRIWTTTALSLIGLFLAAVSLPQ